MAAVDEQRDGGNQQDRRRGIPQADRGEFRASRVIGCRHQRHLDEAESLLCRLGAEHHAIGKQRRKNWRGAGDAALELSSEMHRIARFSIEISCFCQLCVHPWQCRVKSVTYGCDNAMNSRFVGMKDV